MESTRLWSICVLAVVHVAVSGTVYVEPFLQVRYCSFLFCQVVRDSMQK